MFLSNSLSFLRLSLAVVFLNCGINFAYAQSELGIAAIVNEDIITQLDVSARLRLAIISSKAQDNTETRQRLFGQVLRTLIDERLKAQEAKRLGITVDQSEIDRRIDRIAERSNMSRTAFEQFLDQNGILLDTLIRQVDADLKWSRIVQRRLRPRITVSNNEIADERARMQSSPTEPEYRLLQIFLAVDNPEQESSVKDSALRLLDQLQSGTDFASLASQFSQDEASYRGGDWGWMRLNQMEPEVANGISSIPIGQIVGPVRGTGGYYLAVAQETRQIGAVLESSGIVEMRQVFWPLPSNAAEKEVDRANEEAKKLAEQIQGCDTISDIVTKAETGTYRDLGSLTVDSLPSNIQTLALNLAIGVPSEPTRSESGVGLYVICSRQEGEEAATSDTAIAERLARQRLDTLARGYLTDLRRNAVIDVRLPQ